MEPISTAIAVGGSLLSGLLSGNAQRKAAKAQQRAIAEANRIAGEQYQQGLGYLRPYEQAGQTGLNAFQRLYGLGGQEYDPSVVTESPEYMQAMDSGVRAVDNSAASRGMLMSGSTLRNNFRLGNEVAAKTRGMLADRYGQLGTMGFQAGNNMASLGQNYAGTVGENTISGGRARAQGIIGRSDALLGGLQGAAGAFSDYFGSLGERQKKGSY
jgi:hypothetical protein